MARGWTHLVRFESSDGNVYQGDAILPAGITEATGASQARTIVGDPFGTFTWGPVVPIVRLVSPLAIRQVPTVRCLGLNFKKHAAESNIPLPQYPVVIAKPATAVNGPNNDIVVSSMAQQGGAVDYEVELVVVIGKQCRNVSPEDALDYVAGYTVGNDVSQREWQFARGGGQWNVSKMFDGWAPIGPAIVAPRALPLPVEKLRLSSRVNGELRQSELAGDMVFSPAAAISFLSQGATLLPGDLIFMGTPAGVGLGFKPPKYLNNGDVVECQIDGLGSIRSKFVFSDDAPQLSIDPPAQPKSGLWSRLTSRL